MEVFHILPLEGGPCHPWNQMPPGHFSHGHAIAILEIPWVIDLWGRWFGGSAHECCAKSKTGWHRHSKKNIYIYNIHYIKNTYTSNVFKWCPCHSVPFKSFWCLSAPWLWLAARAYTQSQRMCTLNHPYCLQNTPSMSIGSIGPGAWALDSRATWWCAATWVKWFAKPWPQSRRARWNFIERRKQLPQMLKTTVPTELQTSHFTLWSLLDFVNFLTELKWTEVVKWLFIQQSIGIHMHTTKIPSVSSVLPCYTSTSKSSTKCLACAATKDAPKAWCLVEKKSVAALFETWTWRFLPILDLTVCVPIENWLEKII